MLVKPLLCEFSCISTVCSVSLILRRLLLSTLNKLPFQICPQLQIYLPEKDPSTDGFCLYDCFSGLQLGPAQERNKVRWRPGQEASLAPPYWNLRSFGSKCTVLKKVLVTLLGLFGPPIVIRRPEKYAPRSTPRYASGPA